MKKFKPVIICAVVLLVFGIGAFSVMKLTPEKDPLGDDYELTDNYSFDAELLTTRNSRDVELVEFEIPNGESFAIAFRVDEYKTQIGTMLDTNPRFKYDQTKMLELCGYMGSLSSLATVGEGEDSEFGLDSPQRIVTISYIDGEKATILVGDPLPVGTGVYVRREDDSTIYTVGESTTKLLMQDKNAYRDLTLFNLIQNPDLINYVSIIGGGEELCVIRKEKPEIIGQVRIDYELTSPIKADANPGTIYERFLDKICDIAPDKIVEDEPKDLGKYGLSNPTRLKFTTLEEESVSLLIGGKSENGGRYIMLEGVPSVIQTTKELDFLSADYIDLMSKLIWYHDINKVSEISYTLSDGKTHTLSLSSNGADLTGKYDGREISEQNARMMFVCSVQFTADGKYTSDMKYNPKAAVSMRLKFTDGKTTTLALYEINERQYAASVDGEKPFCYVAVGELNSLLEGFELLHEGKDLPNMLS